MSGRSARRKRSRLSASTATTDAKSTRTKSRIRTKKPKKSQNSQSPTSAKQSNCQRIAVKIATFMIHLRRHHFFYYFKTLFTFFGVFMTIITGHYYLLHFYASQCASTLLTTMLNAGSPLCQFVNLIQYKLAQQYIYFWAAAGATVAAWILHKLGCWNIPQQGAIVPRNNTRRHRSSNGNGNGSGPTFMVVDDDDDINGNRKQVISDHPNDALVDQIAQWKIANPHLTFTSEKLKELLCNDEEEEEEEDDEEGGGGEAGEGEDNDGNDAASPCFVWSRQNGPQNNPPIEFDLSMVGVGIVPVEESFYSDNDDE